MACSARARRACYHHSTDSTLNCMGMQRTARGPLRVPPSLNTDSTSCEAPRGTCSHPAPSRHAHPTLPLVPLPASSVYICALLYIHGYMPQWGPLQPINRLLSCLAHAGSTARSSRHVFTQRSVTQCLTRGHPRSSMLGHQRAALPSYAHPVPFTGCCRAAPT